MLNFCGKDKYRINFRILNHIKHKLMPNPILWPTQNMEKSVSQGFQGSINRSRHN